MILKRLSIFLVMLGLTLIIRAADGQSPYSDIVYGTQDTKRQILDVFLPTTNESSMPVIFMVHGGGYIFGDKTSLLPAVQFFVDQGYAVVTPNYRLAPAFPYPLPLDDIFCAYAWTLNHAETYHFDLGRITVLGESAGANAASLLAAVDTPETYLTHCDYHIPKDVTPKAAVLYYIPVDLSTCRCPAAKQLAAVYLGLQGYDPKQEDEIRRRSVEASPLVWLDGSEPPFLLFHGTADTLIPLSESELFVQKVIDVGGKASLIKVKDAMHGFFARPRYPQAQETWQQTIDFLDAHGAGTK